MDFLRRLKEKNYAILYYSPIFSSTIKDVLMKNLDFNRISLNHEEITKSANTLFILDISKITSMKKDSNKYIFLCTFGNILNEDDSIFFFENNFLDVDIELKNIQCENLELTVKTNLLLNSTNNYVNSKKLKKSSFLSNNVTFTSLFCSNIMCIHSIDNLNISDVLRCLRTENYTLQYPRKFTIIFYNNNNDYIKYKKYLDNFNKHRNAKIFSL